MAGPLAAQPRYVLTDLGRVSTTIGLSPETIPINASGQVAFGRMTEDGTALRATRYSAGTFTDLGVLPGDTGSRPYAINDAGDIAGTSGQMVQPVPNAPWALRHDRVFVHRAGAMQEIDVSLGTTGSGTRAAYGINSTGEVVGVSISRGFLFTAGKAERLISALDARSDARGINAAGIAVGVLSSTVQRAVMFANGSTIDLGTLGGSQAGAECINSSGQIAGWSARADGTTRAFLHRGGQMQELPSLPNTNSSNALAINSCGECVGVCVTSSGRRAVLFANGTVTDLNTLVLGRTPDRPSGFGTLTDGGGINDLGQITGKGSFFEPGAMTSTTHAFLATPACQLSPKSVLAASGSTVVITARPLVPVTSYRWRRNGLPIAGATLATLVLDSVATARSGTYTCEVQSGGAYYLSDDASLAVQAMAPAETGRLLNVSVLTTLGQDDAFTLGVVARGSANESLPLLLRAAGPALARLNVTDAAADPRLEVLRGQARVAASDNWGDSADVMGAATRVGAFAFSPGSHDAAVFLPSSPAGESSVRVAASGAGRVLAEVYDATAGDQLTGSSSRLINLSVLKSVGEGLTAGFVLGGSSTTTVLVRAVGPSLAAFGVAGALENPSLVLHAGDKVYATNDDWGGATAASHLVTAIERAGAFALPHDSKDAALLVTLPPGNYSATVKGINGATGVALLEVYEVW